MQPPPDTMLSSFLIALREGVEAALVVGICLAYLGKINRRDLVRPVWYAVAAAALASLAGAALLETLAWNQEAVEGVFLLVAAVLMVTMIVWMRRVARTLKGDIEQRVDRLAGRAHANSFGASLGLFLFVFVMVLREGIETVLLLGAVSLNAAGLGVITGTGLGLGLAVALGVFFFKGALPIRLPTFFDATSLMLIIIAVQLTLTGIHELSEAMLIPSSPAMMHLLGPIVRNDVFFFVLLLATATWLVGRELLRRRHAAGRDEAQQRRERRWMAATAATALVVLVALAAEHLYAFGQNQPSRALPVRAASDTVRIPLASVDDGRLHRFQFLGEGVSVNFLVVRHPEGRLMAGLEACTICGAHGYYQQGEMLICRNCAAEISLTHFDSPGGCNPVPLAAHVEADEL
ncbi:MAG: Fe-S-containing protein, partial [Terriglobia bacterium]